MLLQNKKSRYKPRIKKNNCKNKLNFNGKNQRSKKWQSMECDPGIIARFAFSFKMNT